MKYYVVQVVESSYAAVNAPSRENVDAAWRSAESRPGRWVGPAPRITRTGGATANILHPLTRQMQTSVAGLYELPEADTASTQVALEDLRRRIDRNLAEISPDWSGATVAVYNEALNGPIEFWRCSANRDFCASNTRTATQFPILNDDAPENPIGPTDGTSHPTTPTTYFGGLMSSVAQSAGTIAWSATALLAVGGAVYLWQTLNSARAVRAMADTKAPQRT